MHVTSHSSVNCSRQSLQEVLILFCQTSGDGFCIMRVHSSGRALDIHLQIKMFAGLYHGNEALCEVQETDELPVQEGSCNMKVELTFPIIVADVPRSARLCFAVCAAATTKKKTSRVSFFVC